jgi:AcrR family transcriptional regulator
MTPPRAKQKPADRRWRFPRGTGGLSPEIIDEIQRARIFEATCAAITEEGGFGRMAVTDILDRAGTSTRSFYEHFDNKETCVLAAFVAYGAQLGSDLAAAWADAKRWPEKVSAAISAALEFGAQAPLQLRFLLLGAQSAGPKLVSEQRLALERLAARLHEGRSAYEKAADLPAGTEEMIVAGIVWRIGRALLDGEALDQLGPELVEFALAPYVGAGRARRLAGP